MGEFECLSCDDDRVFSNANYDESGYCLPFVEKMELFSLGKNISYLIENAVSVSDLFEVAIFL